MKTNIGRLLMTIGLSAVLGSSLIVAQSSPSGKADIPFGFYVRDTMLPAGSYTVDATTCSGGVLSSSDFTIAGYSGSFYLVYKDALTVTATDMNRAYGHPNPAFGYQVTGFVNGEGTAAISGAPSITTTATSTSDAGTYPITPALGTLAAANYYFTFAPGTLTVNPAQVSVTVAGATVTSDDTFTVSEKFG